MDKEIIRKICNKHQLNWSIENIGRYKVLELKGRKGFKYYIYSDGLCCVDSAYKKVPKFIYKLSNDLGLETR